MKENVKAFLCYCTPIIWLLILMQNVKKNQDYVKFHLKNALGIYLLAFILVMILWVSRLTPSIAIYAERTIRLVLGFIFIIYVLSASYALKGDKTKSTFFGNFFQRIFKF